MIKKKIVNILFLASITIILIQSCDTTDPKPPAQNIPDTTTQNFTFETYEFGDGFSSSYFNDVWIFDENNIWAVGELRLANGLTNIMRWDGTKWYSQKPWFTSSGFQGIWAFDSANIFFASGAVRKYEHGKFIEFDLGHLGFSNGQAVHKLWGSSESNIWGVGPWGTIVHYDGNKWEKIDFPTEWYFNNITGSKEIETAYATAWKTGDIVMIAELKGKNIQIIYRSDENKPELKSYTIKYFDEGLYLGRSDLVSTKLWRYDIVTKKTKVLKDLFNTTMQMSVAQIALSDTNDVYYFGRHEGEGMMIHYNGIRYTGFSKSIRASDNYGGAYSIENLCVTVGYSNNKAYITKIKRK